MTPTIILIGPEAAGKTTLSSLLSTSLSLPLFSLDRHRNTLYAPYSYSSTTANTIYETQGSWALYTYWSRFEFLAVRHVLTHALRPGDEFHGKILDFGAGHSVHEAKEDLDTIADLMTPFPHVFLILPCKDPGEAARIMEARRGKDLDLNNHFLEHESNARLAKHTVYTKDRTPEECVDEILRIIKESPPSE